MKVLTLHQPWASLVALGVKTIETRSWSTEYRGPLAIHAAKRTADFETVKRLVADRSEAWAAWFRAGLAPSGQVTMPLGVIVATCELVDVVPVPGVMKDGDCSETLWADGRDLADDEAFRFTGLIWWLNENQRPYGDFSDCRYAWLLEGMSAAPRAGAVQGRAGPQQNVGAVVKLSPVDAWPDLRVTVHVLPWTWRLRPSFYIDEDDGWRGHASFRWLFLDVSYWGNAPMFTEPRR